MRQKFYCQEIFTHVREKNCEKILELLSQGADINTRSNDDYEITPLIQAASADDKEMMRFLLKNEADPNIADVNHVTALLEIIANQENDDSLETIQLFIRYGANLNTLHTCFGQWHTLLSAAVFNSRNSTKTVRLLLYNNADPNFSSKMLKTRRYGMHHYKGNGRTPLHSAVEKEDFEKVCLLLESGGYNDSLMNTTNFSTSNNMTCLQLAREKNNINIIKILEDAKKNSQVFQRLKPNATELKFLKACDENDEVIVKNLVQNISAYFFYHGLRRTAKDSSSTLFDYLLEYNPFFLDKGELHDLLLSCARREQSVILKICIDRFSKEYEDEVFNILRDAIKKGNLRSVKLPSIFKREKNHYRYDEITEFDYEEKRNFHLVEFNKLYSQKKEEHPGFFDGLKEKIDCKYTLPSQIKLINQLVRNNDTFSLDVVELILSHDNPEQASLIISILKDPYCTVKTFSDILESRSPIFSAKCLNILKKRNCLTEQRQKKLLGHPAADKIYEFFKMVDQLNFPKELVENGLDNFLDNPSLPVKPDEWADVHKPGIVQLRKSCHDFIRTSYCDCPDSHYYLPIVFRTENPLLASEILWYWLASYRTGFAKSFYMDPNYIALLNVIVTKTSPIEKAKTMLHLYETGGVKNPMHHEEIILKSSNDLNRFNMLAAAYIVLNKYSLLENEQYRRLLWERKDLYGYDIEKGFLYLYTMKILTNDNITDILQNQKHMEKRAKEICITLDRDKFYAFYIEKFFKAFLFSLYSDLSRGDFDQIVLSILKLNHVENCLFEMEYNEKKRQEKRRRDLERSQTPKDDNLTQGIFRAIDERRILERGDSSNAL